MCAGYLLSLLPTLLLLIGVIASLWQLFRELCTDVFILLGLSLAVATALVYYDLEVPCYGSAKAFYGLSALVPLVSLLQPDGMLSLTEESGVNYRLRFYWRFGR